MCKFNRKVEGCNFDFDDLDTIMRCVERLFKVDNSEVELLVNFD